MGHRRNYLIFVACFYDRPLNFGQNVIITMLCIAVLFHPILTLRQGGKARTEKFLPRGGGGGFGFLKFVLVLSYLEALAGKIDKVTELSLILKKNIKERNESGM